MIIFIIIGVILGGGLTVYGAVTVRQLDDSLAARLGRYELQPARSLTELELQVPRSERLLGPARRRIARTVRQFTPVGTIEKTQLVYAEGPAGAGPVRHYGLVTEVYRRSRRADMLEEADRFDGRFGGAEPSSISIQDGSAPTS